MAKKVTGGTGSDGKKKGGSKTLTGSSNKITGNGKEKPSSTEAQISAAMQEAPENTGSAAAIAAELNGGGSNPLNGGGKHDAAAENPQMNTSASTNGTTPNLTLTGPTHIEEPAATPELTLTGPTTIEDDTSGSLSADELAALWAQQQQNHNDTATSSANQFDREAYNARMAELEAASAKRLEDAKARLQESLDYSYGRKLEKSNAAYDKQISAQDRAMIGRGMQRSSYGQQVLAGLANDKIAAAGDIESEKIADYNNRVTQLEADEQKNLQWEKQFGEGQYQFDVGAAYNRDTLNETIRHNQAGENYNMANLGETIRHNQVGEGQSQQSLDETVRHNIAGENYNNASLDETIRHNQAGEDYSWASLEQNQGQFDTSTQLSMINTVTTMLQNGTMPSDSMLAMAGLTRAEAQKMLKTQTTSGGGSRRTGNPNNGTQEVPSIIPASLADEYRRSGYGSDSRYSTPEQAAAAWLNDRYNRVQNTTTNPSTPGRTTNSYNQ